MASSGIGRRREAAKAEASDHYVARRRELIRSAATVFKAKGLAGTSIDDVAKAAGIDRASLYYYVGSKNELFGAVVEDAVVANVEMAERIRDSEAPADEKLAELLRRLLESYVQLYPHIYVFVQEDPARMEAGIVELQRRFDRALIAIIEEGVEKGAFRSDLSPRVAAYGIVGMVNWTHRWLDPDGLLSAREVSDTFVKLATDGLRQH
jgi:TetR/AcrR family transcriptional regulator, cholesterol catabolism regulator